VAVADVFTAILENRPYRTGMHKAACLRVMNDLAKAGKLDAKLIKLLDGSFDGIAPAVMTAESAAALTYEQFARRGFSSRQGIAA
jgi:HD-GYP domain-containing protein (c-di-GMP phosphodiesterase class II)